MLKNLKIALTHTLSNYKKLWSIAWNILSALWLIYYTFQIKGTSTAAELTVTKIFSGVIPFVAQFLLIFIYHLLRSDLYLSQSKPEIGKSLICGRLLRMVEYWHEEPISKFANFNSEYMAYQELEKYRLSYEFDFIHGELDEFLKHFAISGNFLYPEIKTTFSSQAEANASFKKMKRLAKEITKAIT
jgi:hypothetical protein